MKQSNLSLAAAARQALFSAARQALAMMDLTSLNDDDTEHSIQALCQQAATPFGNVAAICVYPRFIKTAQAALHTLGLSEQVAIATVVNFPRGLDSIAQAEQDIRGAITAGAQEIDLVLPYQQLMAGDNAFALAMVQAAKAVCVKASPEPHMDKPVLDKTKLNKSVSLKVIIESGELATAALITQASELAIKGGADFIKTSTGKVAVNATLNAAELMLIAIRDSGQNVGFKAAGGVRTAQDAQQYLQLAARIMGKDWLTPTHMRFGASSLLAQLLNTLDEQPTVPSATGY
ncbi:deoxyribose-phosphate aldolase [Oceanisphaera sp. IT1-181]|uniref:2-deoxyribose-5-phosphate aldolase n=1 Tax=Oceanisphaera sp. IT1-181 TaxID=3081199 RepID=UPI0029CA2BD5|nr:deoxyribose-phosphate aldolase [Oceanisphaera sp. IT1-181]